MQFDFALNSVALVVTVAALGVSVRMFYRDAQRLKTEQSQLREQERAVLEEGGRAHAQEDPIAAKRRDVLRAAVEIMAARRRRIRVWAVFSLVSLLAALAAASLVVANPTRQTQATLDSLRAQRVADSLRAEEQARRRRMANDSLSTGIYLARHGRLRAALTKYEAALALDSTNSVAYDLKGYTLFRLGRAKEGVDALKRGVEVDSSYAWGYYNLTLAYWAAGDTTAAVNTAARLLKLAPEFRETILGDQQFKQLRKVPAFNRLLHSP